MDWRELFLSYSGRINRARWWLGVIVLGVVSSVVSWVNRSAVPPAGEETTIGPAIVLIVTFVIGLALLWPLFAVWTKRWHDRGKSGWWTLIILVPVVGQIWALIELRFLPGTPGENEYGIDPLSNSAG